MIERFFHENLRRSLESASRPAAFSSAFSRTKVGRATTGGTAPKCPAEEKKSPPRRKAGNAGRLPAQNSVVSMPLTFHPPRRTTAENGGMSAPVKNSAKGASGLSDAPLNVKTDAAGPRPSSQCSVAGKGQGSFAVSPYRRFRRASFCARPIALGHVSLTMAAFFCFYESRPMAV